MPKVQRPPKKDQPATNTLTFTVDGERYVIRLKEVSGKDAKAFRAGVGMTIRKAIMPFTEDGDAADIDLDIIAGFVYLARRQRGEKHISFDTVAEAITYDADVEFGDNGDISAADEDDSDPQT